MAKRRSDGGGELNLDSLMDAVTNVVGVLMIVLVMMALNTAQMVQKILSDLPPVTKEEHEQMQQQLRELPPPPADPKKIEEDKLKAEQELKKAIEDLKTVDTSEMAAKLKKYDLEGFRTQLEEARKKRADEKVAMDKLLEELEKIKALLDSTPKYEPPPPKYVRLPNPRPYPKEPNETRILVAKAGVVVFNEKEYIKPIIEGLDKVRSQLEYKDPQPNPFGPMLGKIFGDANAARAAWPEMAPLAGHVQMDQVAVAYKVLADAGLQPNKNILTSLADVAVVTGSNIQAIAEAVVAATKGDFSKWLAMDKTKDPTKPTIKAVASGGKVSFTWGATGKPVEVKATPKDILAYFVKDLAGADSFKNKHRNRTIYDAYKIKDMLERAASNPTFSGAFTITPVIAPGSNLVKLELKARSGETLESMRAEGSNFQRLMRQIKGDPNGVAVFQVMSDAFDTYLEARKIADDNGAPATWDFLPKLDLSMNVNGFEVQRFAQPAPPRVRKPGDPDPVVIPKMDTFLD